MKSSVHLWFRKSWSIKKGGAAFEKRKESGKHFRYSIVMIRMRVRITVVTIIALLYELLSISTHFRSYT